MGCNRVDLELPVLFYIVTAKNGAIMNKAYIEQMLEVEVKRGIERRDRFILEQEGASGHGGAGRWL